MALPIPSFCNFCIIDWKVAKNKGLPTGQVDLDMAYGVLTFANNLHFKFITRLENMFVQCIFYEYLVIYGSFLVERIKNALLNDEIILSEFTLFLYEDVSHIVKTKMLSLLLNLYSRMRGKYMFA